MKSLTICRTLLNITHVSLFGINTLLCACQPQASPSPIGDSVVKQNLTSQLNTSGVSITLNSQGGDFEFQQNDTAWRDLRMQVPPAAVSQATQIHLSVQANLPAELADPHVRKQAQQLSQVIKLSSDQPVLFQQPVTITLPYNSQAVPDDQLPVVICWDEQSQRYSPIAISKIERDQGKLSFLTAHDGQYVVMFIDVLKLGKAS